MKLEAELIVHGAIHAIAAEKCQAGMVPTDKVFFSGPIPGAVLLIGGRCVGTVTDIRSNGQYLYSTGLDGFAGDDTTIRCILEF